jgi:hypothetical protein
MGLYKKRHRECRLNLWIKLVPFVKNANRISSEIHLSGNRSNGQ